MKHRLQLQSVQAERSGAGGGAVMELPPSSGGLPGAAWFPARRAECRRSAPAVRRQPRGREDAPGPGDSGVRRGRSPLSGLRVADGAPWKVVTSESAHY